MINKAVQFEIMSVTTAATETDIQIPWKRLPSPFTLGRNFHAAVVVRNEDNGAIGILQVGGRNNETGEAVSSVEFLEPNLSEWWNIAPLNTKRSGCAVASMNRAVFVVGGADSESRVLSTAETWTFGSMQESSSSWQELPNVMNEPRWFCAAVGLEKKSKVIVVGGRNEKWEPLKSVEAYNVRRNEWEKLPPMPTPRFGCAAVLLGNSRLMVLGGHDGQNALSTCHVFHIEDEEWHSMPSMPIAFAFCSATVVTNVSRYVFVSGKTMEQVRENSNSGNNIIQCYCEQTRKWIVLRTSEHLDAGPLLFIGSELITIGGPRKGSASEKPKAVCRTWNVANVNFAAFCNERSSSLSTTAVFEDDGQSYHNGSSQHLARLGSIDERSLRSDSSRAQRSGGGRTRTTSASSSVPPPVAIPIAVEVTRQDSFESGPAAALHVESIHTSSTFRPPASLNHRRETRHVSDFPVEDVHGESAWYSGDLCTQTNKPHGRGRMRWDFSGEVYDGEWRDGKRHGLGLTHYTSTNDSHEGVYHEGKKHGTGKYKWRDGREYEGNFVNDFSEDKNGKLVWRDGRKYVGQFAKGERTGRGIMEFPNGDVYDGYFVNGRYEGFGVLKFHDGRVYEGQWRGNQANGNGILKSRDGETLHEGWWENDRPARGS